MAEQHQRADTVTYTVECGQDAQAAVAVLRYLVELAERRHRRQASSGGHEPVAAGMVQ